MREDKDNEHIFEYCFNEEIEEGEPISITFENRLIAETHYPWVLIYSYERYRKMGDILHDKLYDNLRYWQTGIELCRAYSEHKLSKFKYKIRFFLNKVRCGEEILFNEREPSYIELLIKINQYFSYGTSNEIYSDYDRPFADYYITVDRDSNDIIKFSFYIDEYNIEYYKSNRDVYIGLAQCRVVIDGTNENIGFTVQVFSPEGAIEYHKRVKDKFIGHFLLVSPIFDKSAIKNDIKDTFNFIKANSIEELKLKISALSTLPISDDILSTPLGNINNKAGKVFKLKEKV